MAKEIIFVTVVEPLTDRKINGATISVADSMGEPIGVADKITGQGAGYGRVFLWDRDLLNEGEFIVSAIIEGYDPSSARVIKVAGVPWWQTLALRAHLTTGGAFGDVRDINRVPIDGASVIIDGEVAARTDRNGAWSKGGLDHRIPHLVEIEAIGHVFNDQILQIVLSNIAPIYFVAVDPMTTEEPGP